MGASPRAARSYTATIPPAKGCGTSEPGQSYLEAAVEALGRPLSEAIRSQKPMANGSKVSKKQQPGKKLHHSIADMPEEIRQSPHIGIAPSVPSRQQMAFSGPVVYRSDDKLWPPGEHRQALTTRQRR